MEETKKDYSMSTLLKICVPLLMLYGDLSGLNKFFRDSLDDKEGVYVFYTRERSRMSPCPTFVSPF